MGLKSVQREDMDADGTDVHRLDPLYDMAEITAYSVPMLLHLDVLSLGVRLFELSSCYAAEVLPNIRLAILYLAKLALLRVIFASVIPEVSFGPVRFLPR